MSSLPKPVLRGHLGKYGIRTLIVGISLAIVNGTLYHLFVGVPRKKSYEEFIKTYDPNAHMKDLIAWGYMKTPTSMKQKVQEAMQS